MFRRKDKTKELESGFLPGWEGKWQPIAESLRDGGGRPESWEAVVINGSPETVICVLKQIPVALRSPLGGVQRRMWLCATLWKNQHDLRIEQERVLLQTQAEKAKLEAELAACKQENTKLIADKECSEKWLAKTMAQVVCSKSRGLLKRKIDEAHVRAFVARTDYDQWDPEKWDGNIWGDQRDGGRFDGWDYGPTQVLPVRRRRQVQDKAVGQVQAVEPASGLVMVDADTGQPIMVPAPDPPPHTQHILEDYTVEELRHLNSRYRQGSDEPLDLWLARIMEDGAEEVKVDVQDALKFIGLSRDANVNAAYRDHVATLGVDVMVSLFSCYATGVRHVYTQPSDWPPLDRPWFTIRDALKKLTQLMMREAVFLGMANRWETMEIPKAVRDLMIKTSPDQYRALMLTLMLNTAGRPASVVKTMIKDLDSLADWGAVTRR